ncbi:MAG: nickel pincer cofactor biosynthesis protein LarB [Deltaproteobacteria bacterium]|nr:nickel pincer cofactor biosynthesis protein LarB [Deltaproteobacteria bacterium]
MTKDRLKRLLAEVAAGAVAVDDAFERLRALPYENLGDARVDHHRGIRQGVPEVIFGEGKSAEQIVAIARSMRRAGTGVLITRLSDEKIRAIRRKFRAAVVHKKARCVVLPDGKREAAGKGTVLVVTAGTSDVPVAEEAAVTAEFLGNPVDRLFDVGVAGIHRLLLQEDRLRKARVIVVAAGMEGALASVVGGLTDKPVIAVPTSVGYGASFGGVAALLGMLNSCAPTVAVVNIDNGFGAGVLASVINRL